MKELQPFKKESGGVVMEIGSRDGHDAKAMADIFEPDRVIVIEANPECWADINRDYPDFENFNCAISNESGYLEFYAVHHNLDPTILGQSSLRYKPSYDEIADKIQIRAYTLDEFVENESIDSIEVIKIDVEGATYEVLEGFSKIRMTRLFHIESEHVQFWEGQKLYEDTARFMTDAGYEQVYYAPAWVQQSDSIWLRKD